MSTGLTWQIISTDYAATISLGEKLGAKLRGGELIELISDVGGGKTTLVKGIVRGAGSGDQVASPSFTISRQYQAKALTFHHLDFYRLQDPGVIANELSEFLEDDRAVVLIEWADIVENVLPVPRFRIHITATKENERVITLNCPAAWQYLMLGKA